MPCEMHLLFGCSIWGFYSKPVLSGSEKQGFSVLFCLFMVSKSVLWASPCCSGKQPVFLAWLSLTSHTWYVTDILPEIIPNIISKFCENPGFSCVVVRKTKQHHFKYIDYIHEVYCFEAKTEPRTRGDQG